MARNQILLGALIGGDVPMISFMLNDYRLRHNDRSTALRITFLQVAVLHGRCIEVIRRLVRAGCRINSTNGIGDTALHMAAQRHRIHIAAELIRLGADVRVRNNYGETALHFAVSNKSHVDVLNEMIPNGARLREMDFYGLGCLRAATADGRSRHWIPDLVASYEGKTIYSEELRGLVRMLLDAGADVNARDANGCSPIQCAVYTGDLQLVQLLIDAGADLNNRNGGGATALHDAVLTGNEAMVHLLLSRGADVNVETEGANDTALHWAAELNIGNSHEGVIKRLVEFGSDLNKGAGETPFQMILRLGDVDLVTFLVDEHRADLNQLYPDGSNSLTHAAQNQDQRVMDLVLQRSARLEINHRCEDMGLAPLHYASAMSLLGNVRWLISRGADVNVKDKYGRAPLYHCVDRLTLFGELTDVRTEERRQARRQVMILLLECGANVNNIVKLSEEKQLTALEHAIALEDIDEWKLIIEYVAEFEARTNQPLFDEYNLRVIERNLEVESYYRKCQAELTAMRRTKIESCSVSYLSVLTQRLDVVARYTRNDELVDNLQLTLQSDAYPIYAKHLKNKFEAASARRIRLDRAFAVLSETMKFANLTDSILENILKYFNEADIEALNGST